MLGLLLNLLSMDLTDVVFIIVFCILCSVLVYAFLQLVRNQIVFNIRHKWIENSDKRWHVYSYDYMFNPKKHNWFGLRWPKEKHYKK